MTRKRSSLCRAEDGEVAVEGAVTMLVLMALIVGSVQFGLAFWNWNTMLLAVEEAGRYAMLYNSNNPASSQVCPAPQTPDSCAAAWGNQNWGNIFTNAGQNGVTCTTSGGPPPTTMTCTAYYNVNIYITSITLSRGIRVSMI
jgi:Flp pilus assembly protein TadG